MIALWAATLGTGMPMQAQAPHSERIYLSGTGIDNTKTWEFFCSGGQNSGKWKKIEVPCNWELQGFGEYTYGRWYTIKGARPSDETGTYRYKFEAPKTTAGERVKIFFDGVMTDTEVFINGKSAGEMHQGGFYRFNHDITDLLNPGKKNLLEVKIAKESANKSINAAERKADWWLYGGIYRPVWLEVVPAVHMRHFVLNADQHGKLQAAVELEGNAQGYELAVSVQSVKDGKGPWADKDPNNGGNFNIIIEDCTYGFCHGALTCGSESIHNRNIILHRCTITNANRLLWLKMRPDTPQRYEYILVEDITGDANYFLYIKPWTQFFDLKDRKDTPISYSDHVTMRNIDFKCDEFFSVEKSDQYQLSNFTFENLNIKAKKGSYNKELIDKVTWENVNITQ